MISKETIIPIIKEISLFGAIDGEGLDWIISRAEHKTYNTEEIVFHEGDASTAIYILISGKVKVIQNADEHPLEMIELGRGASLGEASLIGIQPHGATAVVTESADLLIITKSMLSLLHKENCELFSILTLNMARELARRVRKLSSYIRELEANCTSK